MVCPNLLGGCRGTTGPSSIDPATGDAYGLRLPAVHGRETWWPSTGGCWRGSGSSACTRRSAARSAACRRCSGRSTTPTRSSAPRSSAPRARLSAQNIAFSAVARAAIMNDPDFAGRRLPATASAAQTRARDRAHDGPHHLSLGGVDAAEVRPRPARRRRADDDADDFEVEHYLDHQGETFLQRFDALSYLYLSRDDGLLRAVLGPGRGSLRVAAAGTRFLRRLLRHRLALQRRTLRRNRAAAEAWRQSRPSTWRSPPHGVTTRSCWRSRRTTRASPRS